MKLSDLLFDLMTKHDISYRSTIIKNGGEKDIIGYEVSGFSKSGTVTLYEKDNKIWAKARYNETTEITCFDDLIYLDWDWFLRYKDREPFQEPDSMWIPFFLEKGLIREVTRIDYEIVKKH